MKIAIRTALLLCLLSTGCSQQIADRLIAPHANWQRVEVLRADTKVIAAEWGTHFQDFTYIGPDGARLSACMLTPPAPPAAQVAPATEPSTRPAESIVMAGAERPMDAADGCLAAERVDPPSAAQVTLLPTGDASAPNPALVVTASAESPQRLGTRLALPSAAPSAFRPRGIIVLLHGLADQKEGMLADAEVFARHGYIAVCTDLRAHGQSGGRYTSFGYHERYDMVALLDDLHHRGYDVSQVGVFGRSLGASTALQWAAIDPRVRAVIAVAPFAELRTEEDYLISLQNPPLSPFKVDWIEGAIEKEGHFHIDDVSPLRAVASMRTPIYLLRGGMDDVVPPSESERLFEAARGPVIIERIATAGHHDVTWVAGPGFEVRALDWMDTFLCGEPGVQPPLWTIGIAHRNFAPVQRASVVRPGIGKG